MRTNDINISRPDFALMDAYDVAAGQAAIFKWSYTCSQPKTVKFGIYIVACKVVRCTGASVIFKMCVKHIVKIVSVGSLADG